MKAKFFLRVAVTDELGHVFAERIEELVMPPHEWSEAYLTSKAHDAARRLWNRAAADKIMEPPSL